MNESVDNDAWVMPSTSGSATAGLRPSSTQRWFSSMNLILSTCSPMRKLVSPESRTETFFSIWRTMISICLSLMATPWNRYTSWISSTRYLARNFSPLIFRMSCSSG